MTSDNSTRQVIRVAEKPLNSSDEIYEKAIALTVAINECSCDHCLDLLKRCWDNM